MVKERRNLYRTLYVQPDASLTVIDESHRILMQKLRLHPDQGFADLQVSLINTAYAVLQDPIKRAAYDRQLQQRHAIKHLSLGSFAKGSVNHFKGRFGDRINSNRRNYYRVLQVQPNAPVEIIIGSYRVLLNYPYQNIAILDEAYKVLANPATRVRYDAFLAGNLKILLDKSIAANAEITGVIRNTAPAAETYGGTNISYCIFCHTAYTKQPSPYQHIECIECGSPLPVTFDEQYKQSSRVNIRIYAQGAFEFYLFWPDLPYEGILQDLSPRGVRFQTDASLDIYDIVKMDAPNFKAVAEVVHKQFVENHTTLGVRFLTIKFLQERGNFLAIRV